MDIDIFEYIFKMFEITDRKSITSILKNIIMSIWMRILNKIFDKFRTSLTESQ